MKGLFLLQVIGIIWTGDKSRRHYFYKTKKYYPMQFVQTVSRSYYSGSEATYQIVGIKGDVNTNARPAASPIQLLERNINKEYEKKLKFVQEMKEKFNKNFELLMKENIELSHDETDQSYGATRRLDFNSKETKIKANYMPFMRWHELCYAPGQLLIDLNYVLNEIIAIIGKQVNGCNEFGRCL